MLVRQSDLATGLMPDTSYIACDMFWKLFPFKRKHSVPHDLYGSVVAQSRLPSFYRDMQIADTVTGRYDMLSLHLFLLSHMLVNTVDSRAEHLNQDIFDAFTANVDDALRQLGVGDTSVPKRKKRLVARFYGHIEALSPALDSADAELLCRDINIRFYDSANDRCAREMSHYVMAARDNLRETSFEDVLTGMLAWPAPENYTLSSHEKSQLE